MIYVDKLRPQACSSFRITTESLPSGSEELIYPAVTFEGTDGTSPYIGTRAGSAVTGTPTTDGSFNFTVRVADSDMPVRIATKTAVPLSRMLSSGRCDCRHC